MGALTMGGPAWGFFRELSLLSLMFSSFMYINSVFSDFALFLLRLLTSHLFMVSSSFRHFAS